MTGVKHQRRRPHPAKVEPMRQAAELSTDWLRVPFRELLTEQERERVERLAVRGSERLGVVLAGLVKSGLAGTQDEWPQAPELRTSAFLDRPTAELVPERDDEEFPRLHREDDDTEAEGVDGGEFG